MTNIAYLAQYEDWYSVQSALRAGNVEDVNATSGSLCWTALCFAAWKGSAETVSLLVNYEGIQVNKANVDGMTPLHEAAKHGYFDIVAMLLNAGADPHAANEAGNKPRGIAFDNEIRDLLEHSMVAGAMAEAPKWMDIRNDVASLAEHGHWERLKSLLLSKETEYVNKTTGSNECTALCLASSRGKIDIVALLLQHKGIQANKANIDGMTPLHEAAKHGHLDIVHMLLNYGCVDPHVVNKDGQKPIDIASQQDIRNFLETRMTSIAMCAERSEWLEVKRRIRAGLVRDINTPFGEASWSLLGYAVLHNQLNIVSLLLQFDEINVNQPNKDGLTPLHIAAKASNVEMLRLLLAFGADKYLRDKDGLLAYDVGSEKAKELLAVNLVTCYGPRDVTPRVHLYQTPPTRNVDELLEQVRILKDMAMCMICDELPKDTVFGCGHETCSACAMKLQDCPQCRKEISTRIRRFL